MASSTVSQAQVKFRLCLIRIVRIRRRPLVRLLGGWPIGFRQRGRRSEDANSVAHVGPKPAGPCLALSPDRHRGVVRMDALSSEPRLTQRGGLRWTDMLDPECGGHTRGSIGRRRLAYWI
jgi:hypothetical protein